MGVLMSGRSRQALEQVFINMYIQRNGEVVNSFIFFMSRHKAGRVFSHVHVEGRRCWKQNAWLLCQGEIMRRVSSEITMDGVPYMKYEIHMFLFYH